MSGLFADRPGVREVIRAHGLYPDKSLGQHFLTDPQILERIVRQAGPLRGVAVAEIGPGPTALTRVLLESEATSVLAIELDPRFLPILEELRGWSGDRLRILHEDALKVDLLDLLPGPRAVVANLPYNVATPLLIGWLRQIAAHGPGAFQSLVLMFQKEVAERIVAPPGNGAYGRLAVMTGWLCHASIAFDLPPGAFTPPPKVSSSVVVLTPRAEPLFPADFAGLEKLLAAAFGQRRKMLRAALKTLGIDAAALLEQAEIDGTRRAETLSLEELGRLYQACRRADSNQC